MIYVAAGANLPDAQGVPPAEICARAAAQIARIAGLTLAGRSRWYDSAPIPPSDQPRYVNGVLAVHGAISPSRLLAALQRIERQAGRRRAEPNAPRTLDLDIIDMHGRLRDRPDPILPHPRAHLRAFVLLPLRDLAPDWRHPRSGRPIAELIALLPPQDIRTLPG